MLQNIYDPRKTKDIITYTYPNLGLLILMKDPWC